MQIATYFEDIYEIVKECKENGQRVLIFDETGRSVSPTICIAYMLIASRRQDKYLPLKQALPHVQGKEPSVAPNDGFMRQLLTLEEQLYEKVSMRIAGEPVGGRRTGGGGGGGTRSGKPGARTATRGKAAHMRGKGKRGK